MSIFWILAIVLVAAALAILLPALFRSRAAPPESSGQRALHDARLAELHRDVEDRLVAEQDMRDAEDEITRALLEEANAAAPAEVRSSTAARWLSAAIIVCGVPAIALLTYLKLGEPMLAIGAEPVPVAAEEFDQKTIDEMIASLEQRLVDDPDSAEGWLLLGRSYMALKRYDDAVPAMARAHELGGDLAQILLQYADALAMANGGRINADAAALVFRALEIEPDNITALWLGGLAAAENGNREQALVHLRRARTLVEHNGGPTAELEAIIGGLEAANGTSPTAPPAASVSVSITVDPALGKQLEPQDALFVFARPAGSHEGPPLAATRATAGELPGEFVLDDSMAMAPMFKLQDGATVAVTARVSKTGSPGAQAGDLQGVSTPFVVGETASLELLIDQVVK